MSEKDSDKFSEAVDDSITKLSQGVTGVSLDDSDDKPPVLPPNRFEVTLSKSIEKVRVVYIKNPNVDAGEPDNSCGTLTPSFLVGHDKQKYLLGQDLHEDTVKYCLVRETDNDEKGECQFQLIPADVYREYPLVTNLRAEDMVGHGFNSITIKKLMDRYTKQWLEKIPKKFVVEGDDAQERFKASGLAWAKKRSSAPPYVHDWTHYPHNWYNVCRQMALLSLIVNCYRSPLMYQYSNVVFYLDLDYYHDSIPKYDGSFNVIFDMIDFPEKSLVKANGKYYYSYHGDHVNEAQEFYDALFPLCKYVFPNNGPIGLICVNAGEVGKKYGDDDLRFVDPDNRFFKHFAP